MSHHRDSSDDEDDTFVTTGTPLQTYDIGVYMYCGTLELFKNRIDCLFSKIGDLYKLFELSSVYVLS